MYSFKFQVFGKVQGVFFRRYTKLEADKLNIRGYVKNEPDGTVVGVGQTNSEESMESFKHFLGSVGSPNSVVEKCIFECIDNDETYDGFNILY